MADPATLAMIAKAAIAVGTNKKAWTGIATIIGALLTPIILIIMCILSIAGAGAANNQSAVKTIFRMQEAPASMPADYRSYVEEIQAGFTQIDRMLSVMEAMKEGDSVDGTFVKAVFYSLYFGTEIRLTEKEYQTFVDCFVRYEEREREVEQEDGTTATETYTVAVAITDKPEIYQNLSSNCGLSATCEEQANAVNIWYLVTYNTVPPVEGDVFDDWGSWIPGETVPVYDLPANASASEIVQLAMSRLGDPYSQTMRGSGNYVDCSYLTMWCYRQIGIMIPGTAAEQARYCVDNQLTIAKGDLKPGDLVFWSHKPNGRFMNITHVGVYAGDGKVIDASYSQGKVVYRNLFDHDKQMLYGRPQ